MGLQGGCGSRSLNFLATKRIKEKKLGLKQITDIFQI